MIFFPYVLLCAAFLTFLSAGICAWAHGWYWSMAFWLGAMVGTWLLLNWRLRREGPQQIDNLLK